MSRFLFGDERTAAGPTLAAFRGAPQGAEEESMVVPRPSATGQPANSASTPSREATSGSATG